MSAPCRCAASSSVRDATPAVGTTGRRPSSSSSPIRRSSCSSRSRPEETNMGLKKFRPITPTLRHTVMPDFSELTRSKPVRALTETKRRTGGRDNKGHVSMRWIGGGHKRRYRLIDFRRDKDGVPARVASIEYDPNRSARIALLNYFDGERRYIV